MRMFSATGQPDRISFYDMYIAVVAIFAKCVRFEQGGSITKMGKAYLLTGLRMRYS